MLPLWGYSPPQEQSQLPALGTEGSLSASKRKTSPLLMNPFKMLKQQQMGVLSDTFPMIDLVPFLMGDFSDPFKVSLGKRLKRTYVTFSKTDFS